MNDEKQNEPMTIEGIVRNLAEQLSKARQVLDLHTRGIEKLADMIAVLQRHELAMDAAIKNHEQILNQLPGVELHGPPDQTPPASSAPN